MVAVTGTISFATLILIVATVQQAVVNGAGVDSSRATRRHHQYRRLVRSSNMAYMRWSPYLASKAEELAAACQGKAESLQDHPLLTKFGINVGSRTFPQEPDKGEISMIDSWGSQRLFFTYPSTCSKGSCNEWKQLIWAESHELGCGAKVCGSEQVFVCLYNERANLSNNAVPYKEGTPCSDCKKGFQKCEDKFCAAEQPDEQAAAEEYLVPSKSEVDDDTEGQPVSPQPSISVLRQADVSLETTTSNGEGTQPTFAFFLVLSTFPFIGGL